MKRIILSLVLVSFLSACAQNGQDGFLQRSDGGVSKAGVGTLAGAAGGAILGSNIGGGKGQIAAIAIGTLLGGALGNSVGSSLDKADIAAYNQTSQTALETGRSGQAVAWRNPDSGNSGTITPVNTYQNNAGQYCREYNQSVKVGGKTENAYGRACRQSDGSWKIVE